MRPNLAVVARRSEPPDSLDYFPTPPWATRAFIRHVLTPMGLYDETDTVHEPACGEGHMASVLREFWPAVHASDVFPYGYGEQADYLDEAEKPAVDWVITNPPFNLAGEFLRTALVHPAAKASKGLALIMRMSWIEGAGRYQEIFKSHPPAIIAPYCERVPMHKGRWEPEGKSATAYCWFVWTAGHLGRPEVVWIPPGQRKALTKANDAERFAILADAPLLEA